MRRDEPLLGRRRALVLVVGAVMAPAAAACTSTRRRGSEAALPGSSQSAQRTDEHARAQLISQAVARERALLDLCTAIAGAHGVGRPAATAARDHRAHLAALAALLPSTTSPGGTAGASETPAATPTARPPAARTVADAENAWSHDLLALLPEAPADLRRLLASVAAAEASHAALLVETA